MFPRHGLWRSLVSALVWGTRGPGFKSRQPDSATKEQRRARGRAGSLIWVLACGGSRTDASGGRTSGLPLR